MRGSEKLKTILSVNKEVKSTLIKCLILYNTLLGFVYWYNSVSYILFLFLSVFEIVSTFYLYKACRPLIVNENGVDRLVDVKSINSSGTVAFCWDVLFWLMTGKFLMVFSWKWVVVYLGIPISFFFEFLYKPYKKIKSN